MDETEQPGIEFVKVVLLELNYKWNEKFKPGALPLKYDIDANYSPRVSRDGKNLDARLAIRIKSEPLTLSLVIAGLFKEGSSPNLSLRDFSLVQAPALLMPFAREVIFNVTARSPIPPLFLPPINVKALTEHWKKRTTKTVTTGKAKRK